MSATRLQDASESARGPGRPAGATSGGGRSALLEAARELLSERGLPHLTSKEVAARAGVKPTLVNYYFGDRAGLLHAVVAERSAETTERMQAASAHEGPADERLTRLMEGVLRGYAEEPYTARLFFEQVIFADDATLDRFVEDFGRASFEALREVLEDGRREGRFRDVDPAIALGAIGGLCIFFGAATPLLQRLTDLEPMTPEGVSDLAVRAADLLLRGLERRSAEPA